MEHGSLEEQGVGGQGAQDAVLLRRMRVWAVFKAVFFVLGAMAVQFAAALLCIAGYSGYQALTQPDGTGNIRLWMAELYKHMGDFSMIVSLVYAVAVTVWCGILYARWQWREKPFDYRKALGGGRLPAILGVGFGACIVLSLLVGAAAAAFPDAFASYQELMKSLDTENSILALPYVILLGPVAEELLFRGVILDRLKPAFSFRVANILQAVLFGIFHGNVIQGIYAFVFGMVLGMIVHVTGTVYASMLTHIVFNGTSELLTLLPGGGDATAAFPVVLLLAAVFSFTAGMRYYIKDYREQC